MTQVLRLSHNARENNAKFTTFADKTQVIFSYTFCTCFTVYLAYMHTSLQHCRLVSSTSYFSVEIAFFVLNVNVCYPLPDISGPNTLINPNNTPKCCRYTRLQPVYCQLIALTSDILSLAKSLIRVGTVMLTPCLLFPRFWRPPAFLVAY